MFQSNILIKVYNKIPIISPPAYVSERSVFYMKNVTYFQGVFYAGLNIFQIWWVRSEGGLDYLFKFIKKVTKMCCNREGSQKPITILPSKGLPKEKIGQQSKFGDTMWGNTLRYYVSMSTENCKEKNRACTFLISIIWSF